MTPGRARAWGLWPWALCGVLAVLTAAARLPYSYDEVSAAHSIWLVSNGATPYADFASNHLPFYWYALAPFARLLPREAGALAVYRALAVAGRALFLLFLVGLASAGRGREERPWWILGFGLIACSRPAIDYLVRFSPDALSNPLLFGSLLYLARPGRRPLHGWFLAGLGVTFALLSNNKYALLPAAWGVLTWARALRRGERPGTPALAALCGTAACLAAAAFALRAWAIEPVHAWDMAFRYNAAYARVAPAGRELARALTAHPGLLLYVLAGVGVWTADALRERTIGVFPAAALIALGVGLLTGSKPHSQYVGTWLLLGAFFPARAMAARLPGAPAWGRALAAAPALLVACHALRAYSAPDWERARAQQQTVFRYMSRAAPADGFVIANMTYHPLGRSNTFYKFTSDLHGAEDVYDRVASSLPRFSLAERFSPGQYERDLEARPPDVIFDGLMAQGGLVGAPFLTEAQAAALNRFMENNRADYETVELRSRERSDLDPFLVTRRRVSAPGP